jgi:hypothetical protein
MAEVVQKRLTKYQNSDDTQIYDYDPEIGQ